MQHRCPQRRAPACIAAECPASMRHSPASLCAAYSSGCWGCRQFTPHGNAVPVRPAVPGAPIGPRAGSRGPRKGSWAKPRPYYHELKVRLRVYSTSPHSESESLSAAPGGASGNSSCLSGSSYNELDASGSKGAGCLTSTSFWGEGLGGLACRCPGATAGRPTRLTYLSLLSVGRWW